LSSSLTPEASSAVGRAGEPLSTRAPVEHIRPFEADYTAGTLEPLPIPQPMRAGQFLVQMLCKPTDSPHYCVYTVQEGDSLASLAVKLGLNQGQLAGWVLIAGSNQPDIINVDDYIQPGQQLRIPLKIGVVHTVVLDETVSDLAVRFDVTSEAIIRANGLRNGDLIVTGSVILIPDPARVPTPEELVAEAQQEEAASEPPPAPPAEPEPQQPEPEPAPPPEPPPPSRPVSAYGFAWPIDVNVNITNYFGPRHPLGIDLGLAHAPRTSILAVADGVVAFAGGDACCSYGLYVIVDHGNGLKTLYGHLSRLDVSKGQPVSLGQSLGPAGSTGYSTGPHLHFEVHSNGVRVNPLNYLP
jgi:murein DD-endopeptidase MepM/ murein hydrolase activator NlpD